MNQLPIVWVTTRASGILAFVLLTMSMVAGLVLKTRPFGRLVRGISAIELHRSLTIASLMALAVHGVTLVMDKTINITWTDLLIPGALPFKPVWTGMGVAAGELMLVLAVSYRFRRKLTMPIWRRLHYASYAAFTLALMHGIFAGSSSGTVWMRDIYIAAAAMVIGGTVFRIISPTPPKVEAPTNTSPRPAAQPAPAARPVGQPAAATRSAHRAPAVRPAQRHSHQHPYPASRRREAPAASGSK